MNSPITKSTSIARFSLLFSMLVLASAAPAHAENPPESTPPILQDFSRETTTRVEFKYSPEINNHPALVERLAMHAQDIVEEWIDINLPEKMPVAFHQAHYKLVAQTPHVVAVFGSGSEYRGGNHPQVFMESLVWLPEKQQWLTAPMLIIEPEGWQAVSAYVRDDLYRQARSHFPNPSEQEQAWLNDQRDWINKGAGPDAENFEYFQPIVADDGRIAALKFVFPPYQVGSWADGIWEVDVPASVLLPHIAAEYRDVFVNPSSKP